MIRDFFTFKRKHMKKEMTNLHDFYPVSSLDELVKIVQFCIKENATAEGAIRQVMTYKLPHNDNIISLFLFGAVYRSEADMRAAILGPNGIAILSKLLKL